MVALVSVIEAEATVGNEFATVTDEETSEPFPVLSVGVTSTETTWPRLPLPAVARLSVSVSEVLFGVYEARRRKRRPSLVYMSDEARARKVASELISDVGFEPVDAGPLKVARYTEPFTLLVAQLAYVGDEGAALAYRFERYEERT